MNTTLSKQAVRGLTMAFGSGALAEGTNSGTIKSTATLPYAIGGIFYSKGATDNVTVTAVPQKANSTCVYLITLNAAGTFGAVKGRDVLNAKLDVKDDWLEYPEVPDSAGAVCVVGALKVRNAQAANAQFILGTTDLSTSNVTGTFTNLASLPAGRPS